MAGSGCITTPRRSIWNGTAAWDIVSVLHRRHGQPSIYLITMPRPMAAAPWLSLFVVRPLNWVVKCIAWHHHDGCFKVTLPLPTHTLGGRESPASVWKRPEGTTCLTVVA